MTSFNKVRLADGREFSISEVYHQPRFSTIEVAVGDSLNLRAFNYTRGQTVSHTPSVAARNATDRDTNQVKKSAMNQDESLIVQAITFEAYGLDSEADGSGNTIAAAPMLTGTDLRRFQTQTQFELFVGSGIKKPAYGVPFAWLSQSMGVEAAMSDAGSTTTRLEFGTAGEMSAKNQELLKLPIYIGGFGIHARPGNSMFFQARFYKPGGGSIFGLRQNVRLVLVLDGLTKRPG